MGGARAFRRGARRRRVGVLAGVITLATAGSALAAKPSAGAHFSGTTKQGRAITFAISSNRKHIVDMHFYLVTSCHPGNSSIHTGSKPPSISISTSGRFSFHYKIPTEHYAHGVTGSGRVALRGTFTSTKKASGWLSGSFHYSTGQVCRGKTKFTASA